MALKDCGSLSLRVFIRVNKAAGRNCGCPTTISTTELLPRSAVLLTSGFRDWPAAPVGYYGNIQVHRQIFRRAQMFGGAELVWQRTPSGLGVDKRNGLMLPTAGGSAW